MVQHIICLLGECEDDDEKRETLDLAASFIASVRERLSALESEAARGRWDRVFGHGNWIRDKSPLWGCLDPLRTSRALLADLASITNELLQSLRAEAADDPARRDAIDQLLRSSAEAAKHEWPWGSDSNVVEGVENGRFFPATTYCSRLEFLVDDDAARPRLADRIRSSDVPARLQTLFDQTRRAIADMESILSVRRSEVPT